MPLDSCGNGCGLIGAFVGVIGFGAFGAPLKSQGEKDKVTVNHVSIILIFFCFYFLFYQKNTLFLHPS